MHASNGILFNHESPMRGETFVTRKITRAVAAHRARAAGRALSRQPRRQARLGPRPRLCRGHVADPAAADSPDDYVLATGETHSRARIRRASPSREVGRRIVWRGKGVEEIGHRCRRSGKVLVRIDPRYFRPTEVDLLLGDASKARQKLGWTAQTTLRRAGAEMVASDLAAIARTSGSTRSPMANSATSMHLHGKRVWVAGHRGMVGVGARPPACREHCEILTVDRSDLDLRDQADGRRAGWRQAAAGRVRRGRQGRRHPRQRHATRPSSSTTTW